MRDGRIEIEPVEADVRLVVPGPALVESFSVMTRLPTGYRISPGDARALLSAAFRDRADVVPLCADATWGLLEAAASCGHSGGAIYDLAILHCAVSARARRLLILNPRDFERFDPDQIQIVEPGQV